MVQDRRTEMNTLNFACTTSHLHCENSGDKHSNTVRKTPHFGLVSLSLVDFNSERVSRKDIEESKHANHVISLWTPY